MNQAVLNRVVISFSLAAMPLAVFAFSTGLPIKQTGAAVDGGLNCSVCHDSYGAANSDPRGGITIQAANYAAGVKQTLRITVQHPLAQAWGFQLSARPVNDETKMAGTFTPSPDIAVNCDTQPPSPSPCGGPLEFASHTVRSTTSNASNGSKTFEVEWTPPVSEVGDVTLYASGVAANNDGRPGGDRVYTTSLRIAAVVTCGLTKKPTVRNIVDAAAFQPAVAPESLITIRGTDFQVAGNHRQGGPGDARDNHYPTQLGCIGVEINGIRVPITYVQFDQINAELPLLPPGVANATVSVLINPGAMNETRSDIGTFAVSSYAPAFFTFNVASIAAVFPATGQPVANASVVSTGAPAKPGDIVSLYATGLGATDPQFQAGEIVPLTTLARVRDPFTISIGGTVLAASDILYAGLTPGQITGLYQLNVRLPPSTPDGDVPVVITMGGVSSPAATLPVKRQ